MSKAILLDLAVYKTEVDRLYQLIAERRAAALDRARDGRVPFREIELGDEIGALMNVEFSTHQEFGGQNVAGVNTQLRQKARRVCIAALCELIKNEYLGDFWSLYQEWTGKIADSRMYKSILEKGLAEEGLSRLEEDKRYTDALIAEAGVPRKMLPEVIDLFALYWKYFYPMDVRDLFRYVRGSAEDAKRVKILPEEAERLRYIVDRCKEFPTAMSEVISELSILMEALSEREELQPLDLVDRPERFEEVCGLNPLKVIRGAVALRSLAGKIQGTITPEKFRRTVLSLAPGTRVILPSGQSVDTEIAADVPYFGRYRIGSASFLVMPNELLPPDDVNVYPDHHLSTLGNRVIYKARDEFIPLEGDSESTVIPRELWIDGRSRGFLWFRHRPSDRAVRVGKQQLFPDEGLHWKPEIRQREGKLTVEVAGIRLYDPRLSQKEIEVVIDQAGEYRAPEDSDAWFATDRSGLGSISHAVLAAPDPAPGEIAVALRNRRTAERLSIAGEPVATTLTLAPAMLFGSNCPALIAPREQPYAMVERTVTLFICQELPPEWQETEHYRAEHKGDCGGYGVWAINWKDCEGPYLLDLGGPLQWRFEAVCDLSFEIVGTGREDPYFRVPVRSDRIFRSWDDLHVLVRPQVDQKAERYVDLALYANEVFVAERSLEATRRLSGQKPGSSEFSGFQLRRGFGLGDTAAGNYRLELRRSGCNLAEFSFTVLPPLDVSDLPIHPYLEGEEISFLVSSKVRCFPDDSNRRRVVFGGVQVPSAGLGVGEFVPPGVATAVPLERPRLVLTATLEPPLCGWRLYDDSAPVDDPTAQFLKKTTISREDMAKLGLVIFASEARNVTLWINDHPVKQLDFYEGYAFCELADLIDRVSGRISRVTPVIGDRKLPILSINWTPRVFNFERGAEYFVKNSMRFNLVFEGPQGDAIRLLVKDPDGRTLAREDIPCEGRLERREGIDLPVREDLSTLPFVTLHCQIPSIGPDYEFGVLNFFNQDRDTEMKKVSDRLAKDPSNPEVYWSRAELYRSKGLLDLSVQDYTKALELGLRDNGKRKRAQETIAQQDWMIMQQEIQALANFFIPFCRKELHLEY